MTNLEQSAARLADIAAKLLMEVERLRRDVVTLVNRIEGVDGERQPWPGPPLRREIRTVDEAIAALEEARGEVRTCEYHFSAARSLVDSFQSGAIPRDELAPYIKNATPRARKHFPARNPPRGTRGGS